MIVARNRGGLAQQIRVSVNCFHDARQNQKELYIFVRRLTRFIMLMPSSLVRDQLLCLPEPLIPSNGFSCSRQVRP